MQVVLAHEVEPIVAGLLGGTEPCHHGLRADCSRGDREGVPEFLGEGLERGAHCSADLSQVDHLSIAHLPLEQVRNDFSIVPLWSAPE